MQKHETHAQRPYIGAPPSAPLLATRGTPHPFFLRSSFSFPEAAHSRSLLHALRIAIEANVPFTAFSWKAQVFADDSVSKIGAAALSIPDRSCPGRKGSVAHSGRFCRPAHRPCTCSQRKCTCRLLKKGA